MLSYIVAMGNNNVIGIDNSLPWHIPKDLEHFKKVTNGKTIIMGRKTFASIGRILPNRKHIVLTNQGNIQATPNLEFTDDIDKIKRKVAISRDEVFIIGGEELFNEFIHYAKKLYLTIVDTDVKGDTHFPFDKIEFGDWEITSYQKGPKDEENPYDYYFYTYERK